METTIRFDLLANGRFIKRMQMNVPFVLDDRAEKHIDGNEVLKIIIAKLPSLKGKKLELFPC